MGRRFILMLSIVVVLITAAGILILVNNGNWYLSHNGGTDTAGPIQTPPSQWSYFGGDVGSLGITDSKTPIEKDDFLLKWKVTYPVDSGSMVWRTPSSALCVGDYAYYYNGTQNAVFRVDIETGNILAKGECQSRAVYNMGLAYGDGKIFATTSTGYETVLRAYDAMTLNQLFVGSPVRGGEMQGTITYYDGMVFFGTYSGDYACFSTEDKDKSRADEVSVPVWVLESEGWYNATPAFCDDFIVLVQRGFDTHGATAYLLDRKTGEIRDAISFDREYSSSGATIYEGRAYIPLARVIDRSITDPDEKDAQRLVIRSFSVSPQGFDRSSERYWESDSVWGSTQSMAVIWNDTIYIGGGGKTMGTDEPLWILDISEDGSMKARGRLGEIQSKSTPMITTAYSSEDNDFAVYIYIMEYGHVYEGEKPDSDKGYSNLFVVKDTKGGKPQIVTQFRPSPEQFCYQSFSISENGYVLIRNDSTLFCYGKRNPYTSDDLSMAIDRFLAMAEDGNVNLRDYERIVGRYSGLSNEDRANVLNYQSLVSVCCTLTMKTASGDVVMTVPAGAWVDLPEIYVPEGRVLKGWTTDDTKISFGLRITGDTTLNPLYERSVSITLDPLNGGPPWIIYVALGDRFPYVHDPSRDGFQFNGWYVGDSEYLRYETVIEADTVLRAGWLKVRELSFDSNGGAPVEGTYLAVEGRPVESLPVATKTGYSFIGWYHGSDLYEEGTVYLYDHGITLEARWSENPQNSLTNGKGLTVSGSIPEDSTLEVTEVSDLGNTYKDLNEACRRDHGVPADSILLTIRGDGIDPELPLKVSVRVGNGFNGKTIDVYYSYDRVLKTEGTVENGVLTFDAYGKKVYGGVHLSFGIAKGTEIMRCV